MAVLANPIRNKWNRFWLNFAGRGAAGRLAYRLSALGLPPFYGRIFLAGMTRKGFISPKATIHHSLLSMGNYVFLGDNVLIYQDQEGGVVSLEDKVKLIGDTTIQTGAGGSCIIGAQTSVQPRCQFSAYKASIEIGNNVEIAPSCAFYPYNHGTAADLPIKAQPLQTKGGIVIEDEAWLGVGVIVLDGVRIGKGAVIGAGSVVSSSIPDQAIACGVPARVVRFREKSDSTPTEREMLTETR